MTNAEQANQKANDIINGKAEASSISMDDLPSFWQQVDPTLQPALFQSLFGMALPETDAPASGDAIDTCISLFE